ncbi:uncharacterized protein OCT59_017017 [Rhizophagus irregularis]|nr:hypothetical protein OCT59_017017 [Rhizophagus irregularis]
MEQHKNFFGSNLTFGLNYETFGQSFDRTFDPTPQLKSSPILIKFISFNQNEKQCLHCGNEYFGTLIFEQKYCKKCLLEYIENITDNNIYLDVDIRTNNNQCNEHVRNTDFCTSNIQEWCEYCSEILYFKQIVSQSSVSSQSRFFNFPINFEQKRIEKEKFCDKCGQLLYQVIGLTGIGYLGFKLCSCYQISSGWVKSTLTKKIIPVLYLPWWDTFDNCVACGVKLNFVANCQKWCSYCIVIYIGCRHCLTTNVIFGITNQSQCKKCNRLLDITIDTTYISSGNKEIDEFLNSARNRIHVINDQIANYMNDIKNTTDPLDVYYFIKNSLEDINSKLLMKWIPYSQITDLEEIAIGGFGIIYKANWLDKTSVAIKKFLYSNDNKYFFNELKSLYQCYNMAFIIKCYGITQDTVTKDYMLVMEYANGGNLHDYLQKNFANITWNTKLYILWKISEGLNSIHNKNFIHGDFHSRNILSSPYQSWLISDLGLSQHVEKDDDTTINEYGHDYVGTYNRCWDSNPSKRPSITVITETAYNWYVKNKYSKQIQQAEEIRIELIKSKKLGPEFVKSHSKTTITSKSLDSFISKPSNLSSISFNIKHEYISSEFELDINIQSLSLQNKNSNILSKSIPILNSSKRNKETTNTFDCDIDISHQESSEFFGKDVTQKLSSITTVCESPKQMPFSFSSFSSEDTTFICESPKQMLFSAFSSKDTAIICESPKQMSLSENPRQMSYSNKNTTLTYESPRKMSWSKSTSRKSSIESNTKRCSWNDEADIYLLLYLEQNKDKIEKLNNPHSGVKVELWSSASKWMFDYGYNYSPNQCFNRWKNTKRNYKNGILNEEKDSVKYKSIERILNHI